MFNKRKITALVLLAALAVSAFAMPVSAAQLSGTLTLSGSTSLQPLAQIWAQDFMKKNPNVQVTVTGGGSGVGIKDAAEGRVNLGMSSRALKSDDPAGLVGTTVAWDGVCVIVNQKNKINNMTKAQVKDIFTGKITNWKDVGGANAPINVNQRAVPSGTLDYFLEAFLDKQPIVTTAKQSDSNDLIVKSVSSDPNAIGFCSTGKNSGVKMLKIDGVEPTTANIAKGKYPYVRPFVLCTMGKATGLSAAFIKYALSGPGQKTAKTKWLAANAIKAKKK